MAESDIQNSELPLDGAGARLQRARDAAGLSLGDIAARTKIAERHLASIEQGRYGDLVSRTYAVGFARAYARAVGLSEAEIAQTVRDELAAADNARTAPQSTTFEPGDPARVPGSRLAWVAALGALAVLVFVFVFWRSFWSPAVSLPELTAPEAIASASAPANAAPANPSQAVVFTALQPDVWVKFSDAAGNQLMQKQMAQGESYTLPPGAVGPVIRTARPDALQITVGGRIIPKLGDKPVNVKDVPVSAAALLARAVPAPTSPVVAPSPSASPASAPAPAASAPAAASKPAASPSPRPTPTPERPAPAPSPSPAAAAPAPAAALPAPAEPSTVSD